MAGAITEVRLDVLFSLLNLTGPEGQWALYVNFRPDIEDKALADALYGGSTPQIQLAGLPDILPTARVLVEEIRSHVPPQPNIVIGGVSIPLQGGMTGLSHHIRWGSFCTTEIRWVRHYRLNNQNYDAHPKEGGVPITQLSGASRAAVKRLDSKATEIAYERFGDLVSKAALLPPSVKLAPRKRAVFIAYRTPHSGAAQILHERLASYGNGTVFRPYLDKHELKLGDLRNHLKERIAQSDLFMPLVSNDYGADGSISAEELAWAHETATAKGGVEQFFAPIFLGKSDSAVATELARLVRLEIDGAEDLAKGGKKFEDFLRMCAVPY